MVIDLTIPIHIGYEVSVSMKAEMMAYWAGSVKYGMHWDRSSGLQRIAEQKLDPTGKSERMMRSSETHMVCLVPHAVV